MKNITIVAVDDHYDILRSVGFSIMLANDMELVATGNCWNDVERLLQCYRPDILLLDQRMADEKGDGEAQTSFKYVPLLYKIKREYPDTNIVIRTAYSAVTLIRIVEAAGISGFLSKSDAEDDLAEALRQCIQNGFYLSKTAAEAYRNQPTKLLTQRHVDVITLIDEFPDTDYEKLATLLGIAPGTFKTHLSEAYARLDTPGNKHAAVKRCQELGILSRKRGDNL